MPIRGPEEVLDPAVRREGIAFEIEEEVAWRGCRQRSESLVFLDRRDQLVRAPAFPPPLILDARLLPDPKQRVLAHAVQRRKRRQVERPRSAIVVTPRSTSLRRWLRVIPATSDR